MRILVVSNSGFQYLDAVIPAMERRGAQFQRLATDDLRVHQTHFVNSRMRTIHQYYFDSAYLAAYRRIISEFAPDVIHVTGLRSTLIKTLAAVRAFPDIRVVYERISAGGINTLSPLDWRLFKHPRINAIVMPSHAMLNNWLGHPFLSRMVRAERCEALHYAVDLPPVMDAAARRTLRASLGLREDALVVGTICYIRPWKNIEFVARIIASLPASENVQFAVIGPEFRDQAYMDRVRAIGGDRLKLLGRIDNAKSVMPAFDLYVTPTAMPGESFGVAFIDAMAHAIPALTMNFGAPAELGDHGISCVALPPDPDAWRLAITELLHDPAQRAALGAAARQRVATCFSPDVVAGNYWRLYDRLIRGGPASGMAQ